MATIEEPGAFLVKAKKAFRILAHNAETGRLDIETEYGIKLVTTIETAEKTGYTAARGFVQKSLDGSRVAYRFLDEKKKPFDGKA